MMIADCGAFRAVERLRAERRRLPRARHHLGLEAVRLNEARVVVDQVQADRLDAARRLRDRLLGGVPLLDRLPLLLRPVREDAVEEGVEVAADDPQLREAALVEDRDRGAVRDRLLDRVRVDELPTSGGVWSLY
jgi:hypothetical protein